MEITLIPLQHSFVSRSDISGRLRWRCLCQSDSWTSDSRNKLFCSSKQTSPCVGCVSRQNLKHEPICAWARRHVYFGCPWTFQRKLGSVNGSKVKAGYRLWAPCRALFTKPTLEDRVEKHMEYQTTSSSHGSAYTQNLAELVWHLRQCCSICSH